MKEYKDYKDVKICCYAMCADEPEEFIDRWLDSMKGADYITVLVTKKDNPNYKYLQQKQQLSEFYEKLIIDQQEIKPWRFDTARNQSMKLIPEDSDVLICTDIDEVLIDDFWDDLRKVVFEHPNFERIFYRYAWSHDSITNEPKWVFWYDKITQAKGWKWDYPVHEALKCDSDFKYDGQYCLSPDKIYLHHYPDNTKSRGSYLKLLEQRAEEYPEDSYGLYYLQREYSFKRQYDKAIGTASRLYARLRQNGVDDMMELAPTCCSLGQYYEAINQKQDAEYWYMNGLSIDKESRELYIRLAQLYAHSGRPKDAIEVVKAMNTNAKYIEDWRLATWAWRKWKYYQILADVECWNKNYGKAKEYFDLAELDIKTSDDMSDASIQSFYSDKKWLEDKLASL